MIRSDATPKLEMRTHWITNVSLSPYDCLLTLAPLSYAVGINKKIRKQSLQITYHRRGEGRGGGGGRWGRKYNCITLTSSIINNAYPAKKWVQSRLALIHIIRVHIFTQSSSSLASIGKLDQLTHRIWRGPSRPTTARTSGKSNHTNTIHLHFIVTCHCGFAWSSNLAVSNCRIFARYSRCSNCARSRQRHCSTQINGLHSWQCAEQRTMEVEAEIQARPSRIIIAIKKRISSPPLTNTLKRRVLLRCKDK